MLPHVTKLGDKASGLRKLFATPPVFFFFPTSFLLSRFDLRLVGLHFEPSSIS